MAAPAFAGAVPENYLTYPQAAAYLGITVDGLRGAVRSGRLHPVKVQGITNLFFPREELDLDRQRTRRGRRIAGAPEAAPAVPSVPANAGALATPSDAMAFAGLMFDRGASLAERIASASAREAAKEVMGPIGEAIKPIAEALAEAQRPAAMPTTDVDTQISAMRYQFAQIVVRLLEALRPIIEAQAAGRPLAESDSAPMLALMNEITTVLEHDAKVPASQAAAEDMRRMFNRMPEMIRQEEEYQRLSGHVEGAR